MKRTLLLSLALASMLSGCVVVPARPAYYYHPGYYHPGYYYPAYPAYPHYYYR
ncbi:hypothetical protein [Achromobacter sp. 413638]|uniref:hypothetical protein n=1 Tax=Achromobacter sp. 413638 TaxID=3342385 RepID=UPI00324FCB19